MDSLVFMISNLSSLTWQEMACGFLILLILYYICCVIYTLYFHPLSRFPGPKLAAISPLTHIIWDIKGAQHSTIKKLHDQYGDVIRISPNALAYRAAPAWRDIYGHRKKGQKIFYKDPALYTPLPNGMNSLLTANEADHARMRRLLTHAFSNKALKEQEPILHVYADLLIQRLDEQIAPSSQATAFIDICRWFNFTTFDIIGDLSFGEPFGCLQDSQYHWWVSTITDAVKASCYLKILWFYPLMSVLARFLVPKHLMEKRADTFNLSVEKVDRRLKRDTARPDFTSYIMKHDRDGKCMSRGEIDANAASFVVAGSETTAALLSGCIFYITQHPDKYNRLISEIRGAFKSEADIQLSALSTLPYLNAVLEETLRIYPPIPAMLPRLVPEGGAIINGQFVNKGVSVSISLWSVLHCESNFVDAKSFIPERWLKDEVTGAPLDDRYAADRKEAFQPFSYGPRNCLGQHLANAEMRLILAKLLWHFELELSTECMNWNDQQSFSLWRRPELKVRLLRAGRGPGLLNCI